MNCRAILLIVLPLLCVSAFSEPKEVPQVEPNLEIARQWWPEMPKKWTIVGWPEHLIRFNVLYDGSIVNQFNLGKRYSIADPSAQFTFAPAAGIEQVPGSVQSSSQDWGDVVQGWDDSDTPVLWSEWPWHGYLLREQVFAHVPGGQELKKGDEPLFAWVRLSVHYACEGLPLEQQLGFGVRINAFATNLSMELKNNISTIGTKPKYPRELKVDTYTAGQAFRILEPDGRVRLAVAPGVDCKAVLKAGAPSENDSVLHVQLPPKQGAYVDLLIPMLPTDRATFDKELALGYDGAFKEAEAFWSKTPKTAAKFEVPEDYINQAIRRNLQVDRITCEKDPATGETYVLTGGMWYGVATWGTPCSMAMAGFLDPLGYHSSGGEVPEGIQGCPGDRHAAGGCLQAASGLPGSSSSNDDCELAARSRRDSVGHGPARAADRRQEVHRGIYAGHRQGVRVDQGCQEDQRSRRR